jgi:Leucine-rich repeat (LRR) protein
MIYYYHIMLFYTYILNVAKYTSYKTNKICILCLKKKEIPIIKIKKSIFECEKGEIVKYKNNLYKITKKMYLCIVNEYINNNTLRIYKIDKLASTIKYIINLQKLDISFNKLTDIPKSIGKLTNLEVLLLNNNNLTDIPKSIGKLTKLQVLTLYYNNLTDIPKSIYKLTNLQEFFFGYNFGYNNLTKIPKSIGKLRNYGSGIFRRYTLIGKLKIETQIYLKDILRSIGKLKIETQIYLKDILRSIGYI